MIERMIVIACMNMCVHGYDWWCENKSFCARDCQEQMQHALLQKHMTFEFDRCTRLKSQFACRQRHVNTGWPRILLDFLKLSRFAGNSNIIMTTVMIDFHWIKIKYNLRNHYKSHEVSRRYQSRTNRALERIKNNYKLTQYLLFSMTPLFSVTPLLSIYVYY